MRIEVDMSGKIEQTDMDTIIAFSNNHQYAIDNKYEGKQNYIKSLLLDFIRKDYRDFDKNLIRIAYITKKSKAHEVAANVKRGFAKPQKTLSEKDFEKMIQGALTSRPASTVFSAKLRHGLVWHPSSTLLKMITHYLNFSFKNGSCSEQKMIQGTLHSNVTYAYSESSICFLTVSIAPVINTLLTYCYINLSPKNENTK